VPFDPEVDYQRYVRAGARLRSAPHHWIDARAQVTPSFVALISGLSQRDLAIRTDGERLLFAIGAARREEVRHPPYLLA
jgi:hypothetical protein